MIRHYVRPSQQGNPLTPPQSGPGNFGVSLYANWRLDAVEAVEEVVVGIVLAKAFSNHSDIKKLLELIQRKLMTISFSLANKITPAAAQQLAGITPADVEGLTSCILYFEHELPFITKRTMSGQNKAGAMLALAGLLAKRGTRKLQPVTDLEDGGEIILKFLNQLTALLDVLERVEYHYSHISEKYWE